MSKDKLTVCPRCGSDACYETKDAYNLVNRMCYGCGFMTHNYMKEDSEFLQEQLEVLPNYIKILLLLIMMDIIGFPAQLTFRIKAWCM